MTRKRTWTIAHGASLVALAGALAAPTSAGAANAATAMLQAAAARNDAPQGLPEPQPERHSRSIQFTVPVVYERQVLGDVLLEVKPDGSVVFDEVSLRTQLGGLLNARGLETYDGVVAGRPTITPDDLVPIGILINFNQSLLQVEIQEIDGALRPVRQIVDNTSSAGREDIPLLEPSHFSAYVNIVPNLEYDTETDEFSNEIFFDGATRIGAIAVEYDLAVSDQLGEGTQFFRRGVRAVYDQREKYRRFAAGDLRLETLSLLRTPFIGGVSVEKSRRVFDPFVPAARLGAGEIFLDNNSTVDVIINGDLYQTLELDAGTYDLASLPVQLGSNNVELQIRDSGGRQQVINLDYFYQPLDLIAGEEEYSFAAGFIARELTFEPEYTGDLAFTGLYRRGLSDDLVLGAAVQLSEDIQLVGTEAIIVPQVIPGFFSLEGAASFSGDGGTAFSARASYRLSGGNSFSNRYSFAINVDYTGAGFTTISNLIPNQFDLVTVSGSYNQAISQDGRIVAGAVYSHRAGPQEDISTFFVDYIHRVNDRLQLTAGVEYGDSEAFDANFGVRVGIAYAFGSNTRGSADYRSRTETLRANLSRGVDNKVGSVGYDLGFIQDSEQSRVDAGVDYVGNRFESRVSVFSEGDSLGNITGDQRVRVQLGTSLAFAGDQFAVGRPIRDSFTIVHPHESLKEGQVIVGRDLSDNRFEARSGTFGGALQGRLSSYADQTIQYDVDGAAVGYDVGEGVARVDPPYRSGYALQVGSDYFVSVVGTLSRGGEPVALVAGRVEALDDDNFESKPFFTNSVGRFGLLGFAPGKTYRVTIENGATSFEFTIPEETDGLFRLNEVVLPALEE